MKKLSREEFEKYLKRAGDDGEYKASIIANYYGLCQQGSAVWGFDSWEQLDKIWELYGGEDIDVLYQGGNKSICESIHKPYDLWNIYESHPDYQVYSSKALAQEFDGYKGRELEKGELLVYDRFDNSFSYNRVKSIRFDDHAEHWEKGLKF